MMLELYMLILLLQFLLAFAAWISWDHANFLVAIVNDGAVRLMGHITAIDRTCWEQCTASLFPSGAPPIRNTAARKMFRIQQAMIEYPFHFIIFDVLNGKHGSFERKHEIYRSCVSCGSIRLFPLANVRHFSRAARAGHRHTKHQKHIVHYAVVGHFIVR